ncbi:MAG: radical SAM protein [Polyangiales bacterium]
MRLALIYPPPWKMPPPGEATDPVDGPPEGHLPSHLDGDFFQTPYGLFTLGAQAIKAGHQVKVFNLSGFAWTAVAKVISALDADVFGMSCWTSNRRGVALVAAEIKRRHPHATVIVGGPHASALGAELLAHHRAIDLVCEGESEETLLEILDRKREGKALTSIAGTIFRDGSDVKKAGERASIKHLDALAPPHAFFDTHILMTSRGCPWACTFCGAENTWGRGFRGQSVKYVLDEMELAIARLPVKMLLIKDDTFTTNKKRVLELCRGIRSRGLKFLWSCDTRVDVLDDELLKEMRLAGCERLSLGVESGSQTVLDAMDKKITPDEIIASTDLAKKWGIKVRYYMIVGARGETKATFQETLAFLKKAQPHQFLFSCLAIYPGTRDFADAEAAGWLNREIYFTGKFQEYMSTFDSSDDDTAYFAAWFEKNRGLKLLYDPSVADCETIVARLPDHHAAHVDLAEALLREGRLDDAEGALRRALTLGYPCPGLVHNDLACIAAARGEWQSAVAALAQGVREDPQHPALLHNHMMLQRWLDDGGPASERPLRLDARHGFDLLERTAQPTLPGPLPEDFAEWRDNVAPAPTVPIRPAELVSRRDGLKKLAVVG